MLGVDPQEPYYRADSCLRLRQAIRDWGLDVEHDEFILALGHITESGQVLEYVSCQVLGTCLNLNSEEVASRVGQCLPMARRLDAIADLATVEGCPLDVEETRRWVALARGANDRRNRVVHSTWLSDPVTHEFEGAITKHGGLEDTWGKAELQDAQDYLNEAIEGSSRLLGWMEDDARSR
jgi:hypothetical protein